MVNVYNMCYYYSAAYELKSTYLDIMQYHQRTMALVVSGQGRIDKVVLVVDKYLYTGNFSLGLRGSYLISTRTSFGLRTLQKWHTYFIIPFLIITYILRTHDDTKSNVNSKVTGRIKLHNSIVL